MAARSKAQAFHHTANQSLATSCPLLLFHKAVLSLLRVFFSALFFSSVIIAWLSLLSTQLSPSPVIFLSLPPSHLSTASAPLQSPSPPRERPPSLAHSYHGSTFADARLRAPHRAPFPTHRLHRRSKSSIHQSVTMCVPCLPCKQRAHLSPMPPPHPTPPLPSAASWRRHMRPLPATFEVSCRSTSWPPPHLRDPAVSSSAAVSPPRLAASPAGGVRRGGAPILQPRRRSCRRRRRHERSSPPQGHLAPP